MAGKKRANKKPAGKAKQKPKKQIDKSSQSVTQQETTNTSEVDALPKETKNDEIINNDKEPEENTKQLGQQNAENSINSSEVAPTETNKDTDAPSLTANKDDNIETTEDNSTYTENDKSSTARTPDIEINNQIEDSEKLESDSKVNEDAAKDDISIDKSSIHNTPATEDKDSQDIDEIEKTTYPESQLDDKNDAHFTNELQQRDDTTDKPEEAQAEDDGSREQSNYEEETESREDEESYDSEEESGEDSTEDDENSEEEQSSSSEEGSSEEESDEEEEEEIEPRLKYSRITTLPKPIFNSDPVSACIISDKYLIIATHSGVIHIAKPDLTTFRSYRAHKASVLALATDNGHYIASASMDGTVVIGSITDPKDIMASDFHRPVHTVALDPNYKASKSFLSGGMAGDVILSERGWLGNRSDTVLQHSEDPVTAVYWLDNGVIICLDESGISFYNQHSKDKKRIFHIPRPEDSPRADLYKPRFCVPETNRVYIAWVDRIWNLKIVMESPSGDASESSSYLSGAMSSPLKSKDLRKSLISSGASMILPSSASTYYQEPKITIESIIQVDSLVAGISPFGQDTLMILSYTPPSAENVNISRPLAPPPELRLVDLETGDEVYADELSLKGYERLGLNDYHLLEYTSPVTDTSSILNNPGTSSTKYFIISAKDGVVAAERDLSDRIEWLLDHKSFKEAWEISANFRSPEDRLDIGIEWTDSLLEDDNWEEAATTLKLVLDTFLESDARRANSLTAATADSIASGKFHSHSDSMSTVDKIPTNGTPELTKFQKIAQENWNRWAFIFCKAGHALEIAKVLPTTLSPLHLDPKVYEQILIHFIDSGDAESILKFLKTWPSELFDSNTIKQKLENIVHEDEYYERTSPSIPPEEKAKIQKALADLYISTGDPSSAVNHLLELHDDSVLEVVSKYHLLPTLHSKIPDLLVVSLPKGSIANAPLPIVRTAIQKAISIVVKARHEVLPDEIVEQIMKRGMEMVAFLYLEQLNLVDSFSAQKFGDLQVSLYAEFDRPKLMSFLTKNNNYNLEKAAQICESRGYIQELVYILGKVGQNKQALKLVIEKLQDPEQAIKFATAQNDKELWDDLINYCLERPSFIKILLEQASLSSINPVEIVTRIPSKMQIPGIRDAILHIFAEQELVVSLNQGILKIVQREAEAHATKLFNLRTEGTIVDLEEIFDNQEKAYLGLGSGKTSKASTRKNSFSVNSEGKNAKASLPDENYYLDLTNTIVITPNGILINEADLVGHENVANFSQPAVTKKNTLQTIFQNESIGPFGKKKVVASRKPRTNKFLPEGTSGSPETVGIFANSPRSVTQKVKHLAYIKQRLRSQI